MRAVFAALGRASRPGFAGRWPGLAGDGSVPPGAGDRGDRPDKRDQYELGAVHRAVGRAVDGGHRRDHHDRGGREPHPIDTPATATGTQAGRLAGAAGCFRWYGRGIESSPYVATGASAIPGKSWLGLTVTCMAAMNRVMRFATPLLAH
jgi:hypothetical protein